MGSSYHEVEVIITSAKDLKNVNWKHGPLKPYAVVWIDPSSKCSTKVDDEGDTCPFWDEKLLIPFTTPVSDSTLHIDVVHANAAEDTKPLIGSARLPLADVLDDVGFGRCAEWKLELKRPSGRPQGKLELKVTVRQPTYPAPGSSYPPPYGVPVPPPGTARDYPAPPPPPYGYGAPYGAPPASAYAMPPSGYPYSNAPPPPYGQQQQGYYYGGEEKKSGSKYGGMGTGLAVGAAAGLLGGLAIAEGVDYVEDKIADDVADRVEDDLGYDGDDF